MPRRHAWSLTLCSLALGTAACGGGATAPSPPGSSPGDDVVRCASFDPDCDEQLAAGTVELRGIMFRPAELTVGVGEAVTFSNLDEVDHTATAGTPDTPRPELFDVELATAGSTAEVALDTPGEVAYFCRVHPSMTGVLLVE